MLFLFFLKKIKKEYYIKNITHIITGLENSRAEIMFYKLLKYRNRDLYNMKAVSLIDEGIIGEKNKRIRRISKII